VSTRRWTVKAGEGSTVGDIVLRLGEDLRALSEGRVFLARKRVHHAREPVRPGDVVTVASAVPPSDAEIRILAREADLVAADKPAAIPTIPDHAGSAHSLLARTAQAIGMDPSRLHPTSRLDRGVSGVVVFALSAEGAARLKRARDEGCYARRYVAIAVRAPVTTPPPFGDREARQAGTPGHERGTWDWPIGRDAKDPRRRAVNGRDPVPARTRWAVVATAPSGATLLAVSPLTGRTHQIRVHAGRAGAPLLGDRAYGGPVRVTLPSGRILPLSRIALHAARVVVPHIAHGELGIESPVPADLRDVWSALGGDPKAWDTAVQCKVDDSSS
jgi:23S rRNA-/tRNA-specific pseudouridylate synthase